MTSMATTLVMEETTNPANDSEVTGSIMSSAFLWLSTSQLMDILTDSNATMGDVTVTSQWTTGEQVTDGVTDAQSLPLLYGSEWMGGFYIVALFILICIGTLGNILIIGAYFSNKGLNVVGAEFILNLAVADLLIAACALPMCLIGAAEGAEYFDERPIMCEAIGFLCLIGCIGAILSVLAVSINRLFFVCYNDTHERIYSRRAILAMVVGIWMIALLLDLPHFIYLDRGHYFDPDVLQCNWNRTASRAYTVLIIAIVLGSLALMVLIYVVIFYKVRKIFCKCAAGDAGSSSSAPGTLDTGLDTHSGGHHNEPRHPPVAPDNAPQPNVKGWRMCKTLMVVVAAYIVCWFPYSMVVLIDLKYDLPLTAHLWVTLLAHTHSCVSFLVYSATSGRYSEAYSNACCIRPFLTWLSEESSVGEGAN